MKREIKYRAWHFETKKMYPVISIQIKHKWMFFFETEEENNYPLGCQFHEAELIQWTGLTDKNLKDIYEGDIVKYFGKWDKDGKVLEPDFEPHEIVWIMGGFKAIPKSAQLESTGINHKGVGHTDCEIIGNIYENIELLR